MPAVHGGDNAAIRYEDRRAALGSLKGLSIEPPCHESGIVAGLESRRIGVTVEFRAVIPLVGDGGRAQCVATDTWGDDLRDIHRRAPPDENGCRPSRWKTFTSTPHAPRSHPSSGLSPASAAW